MDLNLHIPFPLLFGSLVAILFIASYVGKAFKFPSIIFYVLAGLFLGSLVNHNETVEHFSEIGIILLFFYLGLEFNISRALNIAKRIWLVGMMDIFFGFVLIFLVMFFIFGFDIFTSLLFGGVAYASSSAITSKTIIDSQRIANPETELIFGIMVFEDLVAPIILAILAGMATGVKLSAGIFLIIFAKILLVLSIVYFVVAVFKNRITKFLESSVGEESFVLFILGGVLLLAGFTTFLGLSEAVGAFFMGVIIAETGKSHDAEKALYSLRDVAVAIFFFLFGASIQFSGEFNFITIVALITVVMLSIFGKLITGYIGGVMYGLSKRASLTTGLSIINRGEFSIVMSSFASVALLPFIGIYVLIMAIIGIIAIQYAPEISKKVFKLPQPKKKTFDKSILGDD